MRTEWMYLRAWAADVARRLAPAKSHRRDEAGYTTEAVIVMALMAAGAITVVGIIVAKIIAKASSIPTG